MSITPIPIYPAPFQGAEEGSSTRAFGTTVSTPTSGLVIAATTEMSFVNDGYTILFVTTGDVTPNLTISSIPDNAERNFDIGPTALTANETRAFGPFQPIWWNYGGIVSVSISNDTTVWVAAISFTF